MSRDTIKRRVAKDEWAAVLRGVYTDTAAPRTPEQRLMVLCLAGGSGTFATSVSAAWVWDLVKEPQHHYLITTSARVRQIDAAYVRRTTLLSRVDTTMRNRIPVTTIDRTIIEAARDMNTRLLRRLVEDAIRKNLTYPARIEKRLAQLVPQGRRGSGSLRKILAEMGDGQPPSESELESVFLRLCRKEKLYPQRQVNLRDSSFIGRVDFCFPDEMVVVEVDGRDAHTIRADIEKDRARDARLHSQGWTVLRFTWRQVTREPTQVVRAVRKTLDLARERRWTSI